VCFGPLEESFIAIIAKIHAKTITQRKKEKIFISVENSLTRRREEIIRGLKRIKSRRETWSRRGERTVGGGWASAKNEKTEPVFK